MKLILHPNYFVSNLSTPIRVMKKCLDHKNNLLLYHLNKMNLISGVAYQNPPISTSKTVEITEETFFAVS